MSSDLQAYLQRIGLSCPPEATLAGLRQLQCAQMSTIALENVDVLLGGTPDLSPEGIWNKLVFGGQGGSSFALNSLLGVALDALGFMAKPLLARMQMDRTAQKSHLAWLVTIKGQTWLVDTGLGDLSPLTPILKSTKPQASCGALFRLLYDEATGANVLQRKAAESWESLYSFDDSPVGPTAVEGAKMPLAGTGASDLVVSIHRPNGRLNIKNGSATTVADFGTRTWALTTEETFVTTMRETFALNYSDGQLVRVWAMLSEHHERQAA